MSGLDIVIAVVVLIGLWRGFSRGALRTALSLVAWLIGLVLATKLADTGAQVVAGVIHNPTLQMAAGFLLVFLVVIACLQIAVYILAKAMKALKLDFVDKLAGAVLGVALGTLKVLVVMSFAAPIMVRTEMWQASPLAQSLLPFAPMAKALVLESMDDVWQEINQHHP